MRRTYPFRRGSRPRALAFALAQRSSSTVTASAVFTATRRTVRKRVRGRLRELRREEAQPVAHHGRASLGAVPGRQHVAPEDPYLPTRADAVADAQVRVRRRRRGRRHAGRRQAAASTRVDPQGLVESAQRRHGVDGPDRPRLDDLVRRGDAGHLDDRVAERAAGVVDPAGGHGADHSGAERRGSVIRGLEQARDVVGPRARSPGPRSGATTPRRQRRAEARRSGCGRCPRCDGGGRPWRRRRPPRAAARPTVHGLASSATTTGTPRPSSVSTRTGRSSASGRYEGSPRQRLDARPQSRETVGLPELSTGRRNRV